jgi:hypothetical protein
MDEETSAFGGLPKLVSHQDLTDIRVLLQQTQIDLLSSIESLNSRVAFLEEKLRKVESSSKTEEPIHNVFDVVSREELGIDEKEEPEIDYKDEEIRIIENGFVAPPPDDNKPEGPEKWADNVIAEIRESGGSLSLYWKRRGHVPDDITETQKVAVKKRLEEEGVSMYKINTFRHFYYIGKEEEGEEKYAAYSE